MPSIHSVPPSSMRLAAARIDRRVVAVEAAAEAEVVFGEEDRPGDRIEGGCLVGEAAGVGHRLRGGDAVGRHLEDVPVGPAGAGGSGCMSFRGFGGSGGGGGGMLRVKSSNDVAAVDGLLARDPRAPRRGAAGAVHLRARQRRPGALARCHADRPARRCRHRGAAVSYIGTSGSVV